jgi:hypothetical protein
MTRDGWCGLLTLREITIVSVFRGLKLINQPFVRPRCDSIQVPVENVCWFNCIIDYKKYTGIISKQSNLGFYINWKIMGLVEILSFG